MAETTLWVPHFSRSLREVGRRGACSEDFLYVARDLALRAGNQHEQIWITSKVPLPAESARKGAPRFMMVMKKWATRSQVKRVASGQPNAF